VLGGGVEGTDGTGAQSVNASYPGDSPGTWKAIVSYTGSDPEAAFFVYAICGVVR
jgi:hypothetical protein